MVRKYTAAQKLEWKLILVIFLALLTMTLMSGFMDRYGKDGEETGENAEYSGIIRFHVRANSNSPEDQELKLEVRNQVMAKIQSGLMDAFSREIAAADRLGLEMTELQRLDTTRQWLEENREEIEKWAEETLQAEGCGYPVKASIGITWIPEREYDGIYFPAGKYEALTLEIGEGAGDNWWCVIFPPLCLIDGGQTFSGTEEDLQSALLATAGNGRILLKSRILELLAERYRQ